jgi:hypothetical protein
MRRASPFSRRRGLLSLFKRFFINFLTRILLFERMPLEIQGTIKVLQSGTPKPALYLSGGKIGWL